MKISIIIPCYNVGAYLSRCVESVLSQTYSDFEVILIDDGSTDDTGLIGQQFSKQDSRVRYFFQENSGVSIARNSGIEKATGAKILFVDADDYITSSMVSDLVLTLPFENESVVTICGMNHIKKGVVTKNNGFFKLIEKNQLEINHQELLTLFKHENLSSPCCKLYDSRLLQQYQIQFQPGISYQEDLIFNLDYFKYVQSVIVVPHFHYFYIEHSTSSSIRYHKNLFISLSIIFNQLKFYPDFTANLEAIKSFFFYQVLNNLSNANHTYSGLTFKEQYLTVQQILNSEIYSFSKSALKTNSVHFLLKFLIIFKCYFGIVLFYRIYSILK